MAGETERMKQKVFRKIIDLIENELKVILHRVSLVVNISSRHCSTFGRRYQNPFSITFGRPIL